MEPFDELIAFGAAAASAGLLASTCGNASLRLDEERFVVSAYGARLDRLTRADIATVALTGEPLASPRPSMEPSYVTLVQLANHGQVTVGKTGQEAIRRAQFFELAAWMSVQGVPLRHIPPADAAALRNYGR